MIGISQAHYGCCLLLKLLLFVVAVWTGSGLADPESGLSPTDATYTPAVLETNVTLICDATPSNNVWWSKDGVNITTETHSRFIAFLYEPPQPTNSDQDDDDEGDNAGYGRYEYDDAAPPETQTLRLNITNVQLDDTGNYTCNADEQTHNFFVQSIMPPVLIDHSSTVVRTKISKSVEFFCLFSVFPLERFNESIKWNKLDDSGSSSGKPFTSPLLNRTTIRVINETTVNVTLDTSNVFKKDNGTYVCSVQSPFDDKIAEHETSLLVLDVPQVSIDFVKAVGANKIFLNWTTNDGNDPVSKYTVQYMKEGATTLTYYHHPIGGNNSSYVLDGFEPATEYLIKIAAQNSEGIGPAYTHSHKIMTLAEDPVFIPEISVKGNTHSTITIGWAPPPSNLLEYIHCYELVVYKPGDNMSVFNEVAVHPQNSRNLPYMFDNLRTATMYNFRVRSCSELTKLCGNWSQEVNGTTMDGTSTEPLNLQVSCLFSNISGRTTVSASWDPPKTPNGHITIYHVLLYGMTSYRNYSISLNATYGPNVKSIDQTLLKAEYESVPPNTNYTLKVAGVTRSKRPGEAASASCTMPPTVPKEVGQALWGKTMTANGNWVFKLIIPQVSERNGPICGYRIYLVRIGKHNKHMGTPVSLHIMSYQEAHAANNTKTSAYIAEILSHDNFQTEVFLGDQQRVPRNETTFDNIRNEQCRKLLNGYYVKTVPPKPVTTTIPPPANAALDDESSDIPIPPPLSTQKERLDRAGNLTSEANKILNTKNRRRRQNVNNSITNDDEKPTANPELTVDATSELPSITIEGDNVEYLNTFEVVDGPLDPNSNYTGFIEIIVNVDDTDQVATTYSAYFDPRSGGPPIFADPQSDNFANILNIVTQVLCVLIVLVLILLVSLYFWHRYSKNSIQGDETISLRDSLSRAFCGARSGHNHRHLIGTSKPADMGPINKAELPQAYVNRHKDTDYGFLREYEILPNRFNDRTTKHSDAKENQFKNRYPDIKAYDQTRVRLAERNGTIGSDYINANFVLGYKERKKFICAQGPMDSTVNDFWRMIWEQHLEIIVMLTNLEEYNKAKCAKYWPEKVTDVTKFGEITVTFMEEQRFSDYLVRHLKVTRRNTSNGSAGVNDGTVAVPVAEDTEDCRHITQYHYLVWKDFMAPEHPHGIIKFIRQINSVYSLQRGPILVHCSAGVGRTGTLVALDSLMQQLEDEGQVSIFNVVCDMRHQRNFLVQSLKQYIFLYRALLDLAQFGNTAIAATDLSSTVEALKIKSNDSKEQCKLELQFEKIKSITDDSNKTCTAGNLEENRDKNRSELVIPFDRNRVILTPVPSREHSTYINASFIEGYDNSESFIVTQDPMEDTIADFWRLVSEQGINTIVMISEIGDAPKKCPRYWADDEIQYDHILVQYMHSESCPYYTRREFNVTNCKLKDTIKVTQFQYNGWPTVEGEVPEVARGMIELVDQAQNHHNGQDSYASIGPVVVHCNLGTERSSIYVAMCILVQHLRTEKRVDICTTVRKLRSQRNTMLDSYAQYEFLHRAIVNYADLHRASLELPSSDC